MASETGHKGQVAELAVAFDLANRYGYSISWPVPNDPFDLIATRYTEIKRVQVKTVKHRVRDGKAWLVLDFTDGGGKRYVAGTVDLFAAYEPRDGRILYLPFEDLNGARERWIDPKKIYQLGGVL